MKDTSNVLNQLIQLAKDDGQLNSGDLSDGYHTFDELYEFRKMYNAALFNLWAKIDNYAYQTHHVLEDADDTMHYTPLYDVHKSQRHHDGELCFGGGWFVVVAMLPSGQITNHYPMSDWDLFQIPEADKAKYPFDGHTSADVLKRLNDIIDAQ